MTFKEKLTEYCLLKISKNPRDYEGYCGIHPDTIIDISDLWDLIVNKEAGRFYEEKYIEKINSFKIRLYNMTDSYCTCYIYSIFGVKTFYLTFIEPGITGDYRMEMSDLFVGPDTEYLGFQESIKYLIEYNEHSLGGGDYNTKQDRKRKSILNVWSSDITLEDIQSRTLYLRCFDNYLGIKDKCSDFIVYDYNPGEEWIEFIYLEKGKTFGLVRLKVVVKQSNPIWDYSITTLLHLTGITNFEKI